MISGNRTRGAGVTVAMIHYATSLMFVVVNVAVCLAGASKRIRPSLWYNVSFPSKFNIISYLPGGGVLGLRPPGLEYHVFGFITPSSEGYPGLV